MKKLPIILLPFIMLTSCNQKQDYFIDEVKGKKVSNTEYKEKVSIAMKPMLNQCLQPWKE